MAYQSVFRRYELKFLLTPAQKARILAAMAPHMELDAYGRTTIRNLYCDTDNYRLIRRSLEKPAYKEKLRLRCYGNGATGTPVFVELKKKYNGVVYKRRLAMDEQEAVDWICGKAPCPVDTQIARETDYFLQYYETLRPRVFLSYEREAYYCRENGDFRVTFDDHILARQEALSLSAPVWGTPVLPGDVVLMEIKTAGGVPLWMTEALTREGIFKQSFSKYGAYYQNSIYPNCTGGCIYV